MYSNELICNILIYIDNNINNKITIKDLEDKFFYNRYYIMKLFKNELNLTIIEYINKQRIYNSLSLIKDTNESFLNISLVNGFISIEYFSEITKQVIGYSPRTIRYYFKKPYSLDSKTRSIINDKINELYELNSFKINYINRRKPTTPMVKKLSIFN